MIERTTPFQLNVESGIGTRNATLNDPEVKKLSEEIIRSQEEEIAKMKRLLDKLDR